MVIKVDIRPDAVDPLTTKVATIERHLSE